MAYNVTANRQFAVNATSVVADWGADVVALRDGGWVTFSGYSTNNIYFYANFQRVNSDGAENGGRTLVGSQAKSLVPDSVTALADGGWVATYTAYRDGGPTWTPYRTEVYQLRFDAAGHEVGNVQRVNSYTGLEQWESHSAGLKDGGWVVVWQSQLQDGDSAGVYQQRYSSSGAKVGGEVRVNSSTAEAQNPGAVTSLSDGGWIVSWTVGAYNSNLKGVFTQRYDKAGLKVGGEARVTSAEMDKYSSDITGLAKGGWIVTWVASDFPPDPFGTNPPGPHGIFQQIYNAKGQKVGGEISVNTPTQQNQYSYDPDTSALSDGGWVTVWSVKTATGLDIYQQRFSAAGDKIGGEFRVNTYLTGDQHSPTVTAFANGSWLVSWNGEGPGDNEGINQRYFAADIVGDANANTLKGTHWAETLLGGGGNDTLIGGRGADRLDGGSGTDTASYQGASKGVVANLSNPSLNTNDAKGDVYISIERLTGSSFADVLTGNASNNVLRGEGGADKLYGGAGNDALYGGDGADILNGEAGNDRLIGGIGADKLTGGLGADSFVYTSVKDSNSTYGLDMIYDFNRSQKDVIDLQAIDANTTAGGNQAFVFIGAQAFHKQAGELRYEHKSGDTFVYGDVNGDGKADFALRIDASLVLKAIDFIL